MVCCAHGLHSIIERPCEGPKTKRERKNKVRHLTWIPKVTLVVLEVLCSFLLSLHFVCFFSTKQPLTRHGISSYTVVDRNELVVVAVVATLVSSVREFNCKRGKEKKRHINIKDARAKLSPVPSVITMEGSSPK